MYKNIKTNNANLNYNFSPRLLKTYFSTGGLCPLRPPEELPMNSFDKK